MSALLAIAGLVTVAAITPGPNNFIVMGAAARGGFAAAGPAILGVVGGCLVLLLIVWAGAGVIFELEPRLRIALTVLGALYLSWLGGVMVWQSRKCDLDKRRMAGDLPRTTLGVASFQLLNPKGWVLIATATAAATRDGSELSALATLAAILLAVTGFCLSLWALAGAAISGWLDDETARGWFDRAMGAALILSAGLLFL